MGVEFRLPPQNLEAEQGVIGSALQDWSVMGELAELVRPEDFYRDTHAAIWRAMLDAFVEGVRCDLVTLPDRMEPAGTLAAVGGVEALADIQGSVPHALNARYYAEIVRQKARARGAIEACNETLRDGYSNDFTGDEIVERLEQRAFALADHRASGETVHARRMMAEVLEAQERRRHGELLGLESGLADLDAMTNGFQAGNLIYVAGRTSMGKTALALNVIEFNAVDQSIPVLFVSLEMNRLEIGERLAASRAGVDGHKMRSGFANEDERRRFRVAADQISASPLFIDDTPGRNVVEIAANARRHRAKEGIQLLVVDLINHIEGDDPKQTRREQMTLISRRLKGIARELSIPVITLAQLNRGPENREGNRPRKSDLKECGGLEEDAHLVILLHRPEYYDPNDQPGVASIIVDKNRNGPTGDIRAVFRKHLTRFASFYPDTGEAVAAAEF